MELIKPLWTAASDLQVRALVLIVLANMILVLRLYGVMSRARFKAVKAGKASVDTYKATQNEPEEVAVFTRAVANQFEAPVLFYALVAISLALDVTSWLTVALAAGFVILRWRHGLEMVGNHNVLKRRRIFIYSFYLLVAMMAELGISVMLWA